MPAKSLRLVLLCAALALPTASYSQTVGEPLDINDITDEPITIPRSELVDVSVAPDEPGVAPSLAELANPKSKFYKKKGTFSVEGPRKRIIVAAARGVGIRGGFAYEAQRINKILMSPKYRNALARHYPFGNVMLQDGYIVPPVITKVSNVRDLANQNYLALTVGSYEITREPRLTTITPSWMDYLLLPIRGVQPPDDIMLDGAGEQELWNSTVKEAWVNGVMEARATLTTALATLNRDYAGMALYLDLAKQGAVSIPTVDVSRVKWRVTADGKRAYEGEVRIEIKVGPKFKSRKKS